MYYIKLNLWHNSPAPYGIAQYPARYNALAMGSLQEVREIIARYADNLDSIKLDKSVSTLAINTDDRFIFQVSGYSETRGMYCDLVAAERS